MKKKMAKRAKLLCGGIILVVLMGLLGACGTGEDIDEASSTGTAASNGFTLPNFAGKSLELAVEAMKAHGIETTFVDTVDGKTILSPKNWTVESHDPASGALVAEGETVVFQVFKEGAAEAKASAEASAVAATKAAQDEQAKAAVDEAARVAAEAAEKKAAAEKVAADTAAANEAARRAAEEAEAQQAPPIQPLVEVPAAVYYANCSEAKAAGAAPMHVGQPGYRGPLDRDKDGIACDK